MSVGVIFHLLLLLVLYVCCIRGSHASWKVPDFFAIIYRTWKVLESEFGAEKSWNLPVVQLNQLPFYV